MLGALEPNKKETTIIGGGFAGMLAAYRLGLHGYDVQLHEKGPWLGGMLSSTQYDYGLVEHAAHSFRASEPLQQFCADLGVELTPAKTKHAYIYRAGAFKRMPLRLGEAITMMARMLAKPAKIQETLSQEHTLEEFGLRHMGKGATDYLLSPMAFGIYGARTSELQVPLAFPRFNVEGSRSLLSHLVERKWKQHSSAPIMAPKHGIIDLVKKLDEALQGMSSVSIHTNSECLTLPTAANRILSLPAHGAAELLREEDPQASELLSAIRYAPLITCTVFIEREALKHSPGGLGVLFPEVENIPILGVLFNSNTFDHRVKDPGMESFTVICGGTPNPELLELSEPELHEHITQALDRVFGLKKPPHVMHSTKWPSAIPIYNAHLAHAHEQISQGWGALRGNMLFGNYTGQVSLRGMIEDSQHFEDDTF